MKHLHIKPILLAAAIATIMLVFACSKETFILSAVPNNPSYGSVSGSGEYKNGEEAILTATPYSGYHFVDWSDGMKENPRKVIVHENTSLKANFDKVTYYTINVYTNNSSWGSVTGGGSYPAGATATLKATPKSGYVFEKWNDGNTSATRTITVTGNATYTATFKSSGGGGNNTSMTVNFGGNSWTATDFIGTYWSSDGTYVIGGRTNSDYPWFRMQLENIGTGTYYATLDTTQSAYWLNDNVNIVQYYENYSLTMGESTYQLGDWQGWNLTVNITSLTSSTISFTISGYMYSLSQATCSGCEGYVGSFAGAAKRHITVTAYNIPFTVQSKGNANPMEERTFKPFSNGQGRAPKK